MSIAGCLYLFLFLLFSPFFKFSSNDLIAVEKNKFENLPAEILRLIASFCDNPYGTLRLVNRFTLSSVPSAQEHLAVKFKEPALKSLPPSTELWHLLQFQAGLSSLRRDPSRFLPQSSQIISVALINRFIEGTLIMNSDQFRNILLKIIYNNDVKLFVHLMAYFPIESLEDFPKKFIHAVLEQLANSEYELKAALQLVTNESKVFLMTAVIMSSLPVEEKLELLNSMESDSNSLFNALLEAITLDRNFSPYSFEKYQVLINNLIDKLNNSYYHSIIDVLLNFKHGSDQFYYTNFVEILEFDKIIFPWRNYFLFLAIKLKNTRVFSLTIQSILKNWLPIHDEVKSELLANPVMLSLLGPSVAARILGFEYLEYRILFDEVNFDDGLEHTTAEDVIVSAYRHIDDKRFLSVLKRVPYLDFKEWAQIFSRFFKDQRLLPRFPVLAIYLQTISDFPDLVFPKITFPVLNAILLNYDAFIGIFDNSFNYKIIISPKVMALVLRDNNLYRLLRAHQLQIFQKLFFSFLDAIPIFTHFDWKRLLALSAVPFNFEFKAIAPALIMAMHQPFSCVPLARSLDIIKANFLTFILMETSIAAIKSSIEKYLFYNPLLRIWAENDAASFIEMYNIVSQK